MDQPRQIFFAPCGGEAGRRNLERSVISGISNSSFQEYFENPPKKKKDTTPVWATHEGNKSHWEDVEPGDIVLFYREKRFQYVARVIDSGESETFGRCLWSGADAVKPWQYFVFLADVTPVDIRRRAINEVFGYDPSYSIQSFGRPASERLAHARTLYGDLGTMINAIAENSVGWLPEYNPQYWALTAGKNGQFIDVGLEEDCCTTGWGNKLEEYCAEDDISITELLEEPSRVPDMPDEQLAKFLGRWFEASAYTQQPPDRLRPGDMVVAYAPSPVQRLVGVGRVGGRYWETPAPYDRLVLESVKDTYDVEFDEGNAGLDHVVHREVNWEPTMATRVPRSQLPEKVRANIGTPGTVNQYGGDIELLTTALRQRQVFEQWGVAAHLRDRGVHYNLSEAAAQSPEFDKQVVQDVVGANNLSEVKEQYRTIVGHASVEADHKIPFEREFEAFCGILTDVGPHSVEKEYCQETAILYQSIHELKVSLVDGYQASTSPDHIDLIEQAIGGVSLPPSFTVPFDFLYFDDEDRLARQITAALEADNHIIFTGPPGRRSWRKRLVKPQHRTSPPLPALDLPPQRLIGPPLILSAGICLTPIRLSTVSSFAHSMC